MSLKQKVTTLLAKTNIIDPAVFDTKAFSSSGFGGSDPFVLWRSGRKKGSMRNMMNKYAKWQYGAISAISQEIAMMELKLYKQKSNGDIEEVTQHELLDLINAMNPYQPSYEVKHNTAAHLLMTGNAFWFLEGVNKETDTPTAIYLMQPDEVGVIEGQFPQLIKQYKHVHNNKTERYEPYQVMHFRMPDPNDPLLGVGVLQAIMQWVETDEYSNLIDSKFYQNGARIGGFLESENAYTTDQLEYLRKSFEQVYAGAENAYKTAALPKGTKYTAAQMTQKEMDFYKGQEVNRDKILAGFRTPKTILGAVESTTNRATAETADYVFSKRVVKPVMELIVTWLNEFMVPRFGDDLFFDFEDPTPQDRAQKMAEMTAATGGQPVISINEARELFMGLGPIEGGDQVKTDFRYQDIGKNTPKKEDEEKGMRNKAVSTKKRPAITKYSKANKQRKSISKDLAERIAKDVTNVLTSARKDVQALSDDEYEVLWKSMTERVAPYEDRMADVVREFNEQQIEIVLSNLEDKVKALDPADLFDMEGQTSILTTLTLPIVTDLYDVESIQAAELLGFSDIGGLTPEAKEGLEKGMELMARKYNETSIKLLQEKLEQAIEEGVPFDEIETLVRDVYDFSNEVRASQVARSEVFRAANYATRNAWNDTGVVKSIKWYTAADERVCVYCGPMHGKVVDIKEDFFKLGDEVEGSDGNTMQLNYSDISHPPLHVSCRCYVRPEDIEL